MGCSQSKSTEQVVERVSVDAPATEAPAPVSVSLAPEGALEAPPASEETKQEEAASAPASEPVEAAVEEKPEEEVAAPVEEVAEPVVDEAAAPAEEVVEEAAAPAKEAAEEAPAPVEEAAAEEVVEEPAAPVEEAAAPVEKAPEEENTPEEPAAPEEEAAPVEEAPVEEPVKEEEAPVEAAEEVKAPVEAPKSEPAAPVEEKPVGGLEFTAEDVSFTKGIAYFNYVGSDSEDPAKEVRVSKCYSEFKALHAQLSAQLADNQEEKASALPPLPKASAFKRRNNQKMLDERKAQFTVILNAIAAHPVASKSDVFTAFLA